MRIYTYRLRPRPDPVEGLDLVSQTYEHVADLFSRYATDDPAEADFFFVPINLIRWQFANADPGDVVDELAHLGDRRDHLFIALGDFSQRDERNRFGHAYRETFDWLGPLTLLALESTGDLAPQDIGILPANTLGPVAGVAEGPRRYLWSFLGDLAPALLPNEHVRRRVPRMRLRRDVLVRSSLPGRLQRGLAGDGDNPHELLARASTFTLCPAGYGRWTYRFFQAVQWGSIPVLVSDDYTPPFATDVPYADFALRIPEARVADVDELLRAVGADEIARLQAGLRAAQHHFTHDGFERNLLAALGRLRDSGYVSSAGTVGPPSLPRAFA